MELNANAFDWNSMTDGTSPFEQPKKKFETDERFYTLTKDEKGNGAAIIRFLPDGVMNSAGKMGTLQPVFKINSTIYQGKNKRFVNEWSPQTIGMPCPFQEKWAELYNAGDKDGAKRFGRTQRFIVNIKVIKDPKKPENEGKIFLYDMSNTMAKQIKSYLELSPEDIALDVKPKELFNPLAKGYNFRLVSFYDEAKQMVSYEKSTVVDEPSAIYDSPQEAINDIKENAYSLTDFIAPESFLSYEKLKEKLTWVTWQDAKAPETVEVSAPATETVSTGLEEVATQSLAEVTTAPATETAAPTDDLDELLKDFN